MAKNSDRSKRTPKETTRRTKRKICNFCKDDVTWIDYKDINLLRRFMSDRGKIRARRVTGNCAQHQRKIAIAIKTARELAFLPYTQRTVTERAVSAPRAVSSPEAAESVEELAIVDEEILAMDPDFTAEIGA